MGRRNVQLARDLATKAERNKLQHTLVEEVVLSGHEVLAIRPTRGIPNDLGVDGLVLRDD